MYYLQMMITLMKYGTQIMFVLTTGRVKFSIDGGKKFSHLKSMIWVGMARISMGMNFMMECISTASAMVSPLKLGMCI
jgi:hypothetical protein